MFEKITEKENFKDLSQEALMAINEMLSWRIRALQNEWNEINREQTKIMLRYWELDEQQPQEGGEA